MEFTLPPVRVDCQPEHKGYSFVLLQVVAAQVVPALLGIWPEKSASRQLARCAGPDAGVEGRLPGAIKLGD